GDGVVSGEGRTVPETGAEFVGLGHFQPILLLVETLGLFGETDLLQNQGVTVARLEGTRAPVDFGVEQAQSPIIVAHAVAFARAVEHASAARKDGNRRQEDCGFRNAAAIHFHVQASHAPCSRRPRRNQLLMLRILTRTNRNFSPPRAAEAESISAWIPVSSFNSLASGRPSAPAPSNAAIISDMNPRSNPRCQPSLIRVSPNPGAGDAGRCPGPAQSRYFSRMAFRSSAPSLRNRMSTVSNSSPSAADRPAASSEEPPAGFFPSDPRRRQ